MAPYEVQDNCSASVENRNTYHLIKMRIRGNIYKRTVIDTTEMQHMYPNEMQAMI